MPIEAPDELVRHLQDGKCVLFAGSGISTGLGLPDWDGLLQEMLKALPSSVPRNMRRALKDQLGKGEYLKVAGYCRKTIGDGPYLALLRTKFGQRNRKQTTDLHKLIVEIPFRSIITTNYDTVLEDSFATVAQHFPKRVTAANKESLGTVLFEEDDVFIFKAHGCIETGAENLILSASDYRRHIHANPAYSAFFNALLLNYAILFVGYSHRDPDFQLLLDQQLTIFDKHTPPRYALMSDADPAQVAFLHESNIAVIPYTTNPALSNKHNAVTEFFKDLKSKIDTQQPLERARNNFRVLAGLDQPGSQYNICFTHKGDKSNGEAMDHVLGNFDDYQVPGFPFDEAEIIMRVWNLATLCLGGGWSNVHTVCSCSQNSDLESNPLCVIGSPKGNRYAATMMSHLKKKRACAFMEVVEGANGDESTCHLIVDGEEKKPCPTPQLDATTGEPTPDAKLQGLTDYALLLVLPNILKANVVNWRQRIILLAGCRVAGQVAINRWFTDSATLASLVREFEDAPFYVALKVTYNFVPGRLPTILTREVFSKGKVQLHDS